MRRWQDAGSIAERKCACLIGADMKTKQVAEPIQRNELALAKRAKVTQSYTPVPRAVQVTKLAPPSRNRLRQGKDRFTLCLQETLLALLAEGQTVGFACDRVGISRVTFYRHRESEPRFQAAVELALEAGGEALHEEARRRAVDGIEEPVIYKGKPCYVTDPDTGELLRDETGAPRLLTVTRKSDMLLVHLMKAHERRCDAVPVAVNQTGTVDQPQRSVAEDIMQRLQDMHERMLLE